MTLTITEADRHPGMYAISDSALLPVEEQVFFSGYFGKHGPWVYVAGPLLLEALEAMMAMHAPRSYETVWDGPYEQAAEAIAMAQGAERTSLTKGEVE